MGYSWGMADAFSNLPEGHVAELKPRRGRPPGATNAIPGQLREIIVEAMARTGDPTQGGEGDALGYMCWIARAYPEQFVGLVKAIIPKQIDLSMTRDTSELLRRMLENRELREKSLDKVRRMHAVNTIEAEHEKVA